MWFSVVVLNCYDIPEEKDLISVNLGLALSRLRVRCRGSPVTFRI